jgi:hypothetical protein
MAVRARMSFEATTEQIKRRYLPEEVVEFIRDGNNLAREIKFHLDGVSLNQEQEKLIGDVNGALTVVRVVFPETMTPVKTQTTSYQDIPRKSVRRSEYIEKLAYVAQIGITKPDRVRFANSLLEGFKSNFVSLEGEFVKNRYAQQLGWKALMIGGIFLVGYFLVSFVPSIPHNWQSLVQPFQTYRSFLAMAAAACMGTWISFLLRRVTLDFADLANPEEDRVAPLIRLFFVIGLTWVIGAFIATDLFEIKIGGGDTLKTKLLASGLIAALIGVVCGISERALASVVARRSDDLLSNLGSQRVSVQSSGSRPPAG